MLCCTAAENEVNPPPAPADHIEVIPYDLVIFLRLLLVNRDLHAVMMNLGMKWHEDLYRLGDLERGTLK